MANYRHPSNQDHTISQKVSWGNFPSKSDVPSDSTSLNMISNWEYNNGLKYLEIFYDAKNIAKLQKVMPKKIGGDKVEKKTSFCR